MVLSQAMKGWAYWVSGIKLASTFQWYVCEITLQWRGSLICQTHVITGYGDTSKTSLAYTTMTNLFSTCVRSPTSDVNM